MKKIISSFLLLFLCSNIFAQEKTDVNLSDHSIGITPISLMSGVRLKYERPLNDRMSFGSYLGTKLWGVRESDATGTTYKSLGVRVEPFARYYFKESMNGFYAQGKALVGFTRMTPEDDIEKVSESYENPENLKQTYMDYGFGMGIGWLYLFPRNNHWALDFGFGLQYKGNSKKGSPDNILTIISKVGSLVYLDLGICYRF